MGLGLREFVRPGVYRKAGTRPTYLPVVSVWPQTPPNVELLGVDLLSDPARRITVARSSARARRRSPSCHPGERRDRRARVQAAVRARRAERPADRLCQHVVHDEGDRGRSSGAPGRCPPARGRRRQAGVRVGRPPREVETRSLVLGGRRWVVTARSDTVSRGAPAAILLSGLGLAALLGTFTFWRASFERRLVRAVRGRARGAAACGAARAERCAPRRRSDRRGRRGIDGRRPDHRGDRHRVRAHPPGEVVEILAVSGASSRTSIRPPVPARRGHTGRGGDANREARRDCERRGARRAFSAVGRARASATGSSV